MFLLSKPFQICFFVVLLDNDYGMIDACNVWTYAVNLSTVFRKSQNQRIFIEETENVIDWSHSFLEKSQLVANKIDVGTANSEWIWFVVASGELKLCFRYAGASIIKISAESRFGLKNKIDWKEWNKSLQNYVSNFPNCNCRRLHRNRLLIG